MYFLDKNFLYIDIISEGGTEEDRRINPPLNFGIFIENNNKIWKKWLRSFPRLIKKNSNPLLDKFRSALTGYYAWIFLYFYVLRNHQQNIKVLSKRSSEAKRIYDLKCREEIASNQFYHQEIARCGKNSKEAEKVYLKCDGFIWFESILDISGLFTSGQLYPRRVQFGKTVESAFKNLWNHFLKFAKKSVIWRDNFTKSFIIFSPIFGL